MTEPGNDAPPLGFLAELRRRRVIRVAIVYAIAGWVVIEVASTMLPGLNLPQWTVTLVIALVVLGFPIIFLMGWMFDLGPGGVVRTLPASVPAATLVPDPSPPPQAGRGETVACSADVHATPATRRAAGARR